MKKRTFKGAAVSLVICFVAVIAFAGTIVFRQYERNAKEELAQQDEVTTEDETQEKEPVELQITNSQSIENEEPEEETEEPVETNHVADELSFSKSDVLIWPVDGNVLLNFSMDQTIYFSTLDQYKYNPALIIEGEENAEVLAAERGIVSCVEVTAETGTTVTVEMGNGYEAVYGQLKEVAVQEGNYVEQGDALGLLSQPTKYYSVEGCNLYFKLLKDGEPINPLEYLDV